MDEAALWLLVTMAVLVAVAVFHRPLEALVKLLARSAVGLVGIWLFNLVGGFIGVQVGVNLFTGLAVGLLGLPGFGLLLLLQCI